MATIGEITLIVKIAGGCNLRCLYCYAASSTRETNRQKMPIPVFKKILTELQLFPANRSKIILHGGEPLIVGKEYIQEICNLRTQLKIPTAPFAMQTNVTLIDESWADLLKKEHIGIGVSFDGPESIQELQRPFKNGKGSFRKVKKGIHLLQEKGYKLNAACVITKNSLDKANAIYDSMLENGILTFDFLPCFEIDPGTMLIVDTAITPEEFGRFMIEIFDRWWKDDNPDVKIRLIDNVLKGLLGGQPKLCQFSGSCGMFLSVNYNGDVYPCDLFIGIEEFCVGNILENSLTAMYNDPKMVSFRSATSSKRGNCTECEWYFACKGGCSMHWYLGGRDLTTQNRYCGSRKILFSHVKSALSEFSQ